MPYQHLFYELRGEEEPSWMGGGGILVWLKSHVVEQAKSSILLLAKCHTCIEGNPLPSWTNLFLLNQITQAIEK